MLVNSCYVSRAMGAIRASNSKSDLQGHWQWCHSIGHIRIPISVPLQLCLYLAPFSRYYHLFPKIKRGHVTLNTCFLRVIYISWLISSILVLLCINQCRKFELPCLTNYNNLNGAKSTCMQNWTILAAAVPEISLGVSKFKVGHVTRPRPF